VTTQKYSSSVVALWRPHFLTVGCKKYFNHPYLTAYSSASGKPQNTYISITSLGYQQPKWAVKAKNNQVKAVVKADGWYAEY
jgi:hypothetical protein